ncbi:MAG: MspA family porin [Gordonia sp. (in: high G+C Gram-positive bacteria)]|uniref:MspA family porin n=1 Tax=Gordonia sp. (in: high G+C Gram-positive bacteria) TaxID=84139 RepID=UPI0039E6281F
MSVKRRPSRWAGVTVALATAAAVTVSGLGAGDADALRLPAGKKKSTGIDGQVVLLKRSAEYVFPQPSEARNGAGRSTRVSGTYTARINRGGGNVQVGYLVGCQVNIGGLDMGLSGGFYGLAAPVPLVNGTISFPLQPGQIQVVQALSKNFYRKVVSIQLSGVEIAVQSCGGFAQARSFIKVLAAEDYSTASGTVSGKSTAIQTTLYGKPFSLG